MVLAELSRVIPPDVRITDLNITREKADIKGMSKSSKGLDSFITALVNSSILKNVVLKEAVSHRTGNETSVQFTISFEVNL